VTNTIQDDLQQFAVTLLERRGALVEWPAAAAEGTAVVPPQVSAALGLPGEDLRLSSTPGGEGLSVSLAGDFLEAAGRLLDPDPRIGAFRIPELYLKRGGIEEALGRAFTWHNVKVKFREARSTQVEYHTWWFSVTVVSEDRFQTCFALSVNAATGSQVDLPEVLDRWDLRPVEGPSPSGLSTYDRAVALARLRLPALVAPFVARMESQRERDRRRLREYYGTLAREAKNPRHRAGVSPDPEKIQAKTKAVQLELRRKLLELDDRYAMQTTLQPIVLVRTEMPALAVDLSVFRKQAVRRHTVYWNALTKHLEPMACARCGAPTFSVSFTNDQVDPLCPLCAG
jgi:hypothetical protein